MKAYDFEYDGIRLSDLGFMICDFGKKKNLQTISNGAQIDFDTVSTQFGSKFEQVSTSYKKCLETSFYICKNPCDNSNLKIEVYEERDLVAWLNRKKYLRLQFIGDDYEDVYYEASFNMKRIESGGELIGFQLDMQTNRPWALSEPRTFLIKNITANGERTIIDNSDEEGFIYPDVEITVNQTGNLTIYNSLEDRTTYIANCTQGEKITMSYPIIESSLQSHSIQDDFNWKFFRIANTFKNKENIIKISLPCTMKITYSPIVKKGL